MVPPGQPPKGGWPIISYGHAMTGTQPTCAPTLADKFWGYGSVIMTLVRRGSWSRCATSNGLGTDNGEHSVVDACRRWATT